MSRSVTIKAMHRSASAITSGKAGQPLTPIQRRALAAAAERADRAVLPLPEGIAQRGAITQRLITSLLDRRLIEEVTTRAPAKAWRTDANRRHLALRITVAGIAAIDAGVIVSTAAVAAPVESAEEPAPAPSASPGGKLGEVLNATSTHQGATLAELVTLTGWLPHTTRAALTRLRQRGHAFQLITIEGRRAYHLDQVGAATESAAPIAAAVGGQE